MSANDKNKKNEPKPTLNTKPIKADVVHETFEAKYGSSNIKKNNSK